ncbi:MAG: hypothetical protein E3J46_07370 [Desulfobacteraceae bacterium]|nr:MAG: hypothetical protein E3J46_07370 [Desulfobacteraceae bacterium]
MEIPRSESPDSRLKEVIAQAIHAEYVRNQKAKGETTETNSTLVGWEKLPGHVKESNRAQALHIAEKLKAIGCGTTELGDGEPGGFEFTREEIELLAPMEHERWVGERLANGWTVGPKDIDTKTTPGLVPYEELPDEEQEKDREAVIGIPKILAKVGLKIGRLA